jgi:hypothetical protein
MAHNLRGGAAADDALCCSEERRIAHQRGGVPGSAFAGTAHGQGTPSSAGQGEIYQAPAVAA